MNNVSESSLRMLNNSQRPQSDDWDDRFHLSRIPPYDSRTDKFMQKRRPPTDSMGRALAKSALKFTQAPSSLSKLAPITRSQSRVRPRDVLIRTRSNSKFRLAKPEEGSVIELQNKLMTAWATWGVPQAQRVDIGKMTSGKGKSMADSLREELARLEVAFHPVRVVEKVIERREELLARLATFGEMDDGKQIEVAELLSELRLASLDVVEAILRWRDFHGSAAAYVYKGQSYFAKMKIDVGFLRSMDKWFYISSEPDPFLLHAAGARTFSKPFPKFQRGDIRIPLPFISNELQRIKQAEVVLNAEREEFREVKTPSQRVSKGAVPVLATPQVSDDFQSAEDPSSLRSRTMLSPVWRLD